MVASGREWRRPEKGMRGGVSQSRAVFLIIQFPLQALPIEEFRYPSASDHLMAPWAGRRRIIRCP